MAIRLVTFDALHTLIKPRLPIHVQYSQTFEPYLGVLDPGALQRSFKTALKQLQRKKPVYQGGSDEWWGEVIKRTAIGAGADLSDVNDSLDHIVPRLLHRFSSKEGYELYDDALPCLQHLNHLGMRTGLITNADRRMLAVLDDLDITKYLQPILISEIEEVEKPKREIFARAGRSVGELKENILHVGDELKADYHGAQKAGLRALLIRRPGPDGEGEHKEADEDLNNVDVVTSLVDVVLRMRRNFCLSIVLQNGLQR
ncbi:hypothetical protein QCA50_009616 [Cerrena zonata]|uniref:HAD hydrolase subfamily IA REG-2-like protein n=1 Tax=Cerrena zonata TaxID=2478898 RepID=A0AAW0GAD1_9APHY